MMPEESTTPDLVDLTRRAIEALNHRDFDAVMRYFAPDVVWDASHTGVGIFEGTAALRSFFEDWIGAYEETEQVIVESRDFGNGVVFTVARVDGRPAGSTGRVQETWSWTNIFAADMCVRTVARTDIDEARAAAERLAEERG